MTGDEPGTVLLEGLTLSGARGPGNNAIHFIARTGAELVLRDIAVRDNMAETRAAFFLQGSGDGQVLFERVIFEDNRSFGFIGKGAGIECGADEEEDIPSLHLVGVIFRNNTVESTGTSRGGEKPGVGPERL